VLSVFRSLDLKPRPRALQPACRHQECSAQVPLSLVRRRLIDS